MKFKQAISERKLLSQLPSPPKKKKSKRPEVPKFKQPKKLSLIDKILQGSDD